jgi:hypothetical protein
MTSGSWAGNRSHVNHVQVELMVRVETLTGTHKQARMFARPTPHKPQYIEEMQVIVLWESIYPGFTLGNSCARQNSLDAHIDLGQQVLGHAVAGGGVDLIQSSSYVRFVDEDAQADPVWAEDLHAGTLHQNAPPHSTRTSAPQRRGTHFALLKDIVEYKHCGQGGQSTVKEQAPRKPSSR